MKIYVKSVFVYLFRHRSIEYTSSCVVVDYVIGEIKVHTKHGDDIAMAKVIERNVVIPHLKPLVVVA